MWCLFSIYNLGKREYLTKLTFNIGTVTYSILKKESQWPTKKFKIGTGNMFD
jgi:hypothetical protein